MRLGLWLDSRRIPRAAFARLVGVHPVTVTKWVTGTMLPRPEAMDAILRATDGAVAPNDFYEALKAQAAVEVRK